MAAIDEDSALDDIALDLGSELAEADAGQQHLALLQAEVDCTSELKYCSILAAAAVVEFHSEVGATHQAAMVDCACAKQAVVVGNRIAGAVHMRQP